MLSLEDFKRRRMKKECSAFDMLVEVASVASSKLEKERLKTEVNPRISVNKKNRVKRVKRADLGANPQPELPTEFKNRVQELNGENPILIIEKPLFQSDINRCECRLSIPMRQVRQQFLTEEEQAFLSTHVGNHVAEIATFLIDPSLKEAPISLRKWDMVKKNKEKSSSSYVLVKGWMKLVEENQLKVGDVVRLYSFRVGSSLRFALVIAQRSQEEEEEEDEDEEEEE